MIDVTMENKQELPKTPCSVDQVMVQPDQSMLKLLPAIHTHCNGLVHSEGAGAAFNEMILPDSVESNSGNLLDGQLNVNMSSSCVMSHSHEKEYTAIAIGPNLTIIDKVFGTTMVKSIDFYNSLTKLCL